LDEENFSGILTPSDEFEFWNNSQNSGTSQFQERARFYAERFSQVSKFYKDLKSVDISGIKEVIGNQFE
jgi:hypothetical protein